MRWSFRIGSIAGIRIELHVTFLLFVAWIAISQGLFTGRLNEALTSVLLLVLIFTCVLLHELGHALVARRYGIRTKDIILLPIGGLARLERMPEKPQQEIAVALAGPAVNVAILVLLYLFSRTFHQALGEPTLRGGLFETLFYINAMMVVFNLIPAFPMDGGRVLRAALALGMPYARATQIASFVGQGIAVLFGLAGLFGHNTMLMFIALFVFLAASEERAVVQTRTSIAGVPVRAAMVTDFRTLEVSEPLQHAVDQLIAGSQQDFPVVDGANLVGMLSRADLVLALQRHAPSTPLGTVIRPDQQYADAGEPLEDALRRMRELGRSALPVLHVGSLVGLVTLENVGDLLVVRDAQKRFAVDRGA